MLRRLVCSGRGRLTQPLGLGGTQSTYNPEDFPAHDTTDYTSGGSVRLLRHAPFCSSTLVSPSSAWLLLFCASPRALLRWLHCKPEAPWRSGDGSCAAHM